MPDDANKPNAYEQEALDEIRAWKEPQGRSMFGRALDFMDKPFEAFKKAADKVPYADILDQALAKVVDLVNSAARKTVPRETILNQFDPPLKSLEDLHSLDLQTIDTKVEALKGQYARAALAEGGAAGVATPLAPMVAIPGDVALLVTLNLKAINTYATYYGFDTTLEEERLFALQVLMLASSATDSTKGPVMANMAKVARDAAQRKAWEHLNEQFILRQIKKIAEALGIKLTKAKLANLAPVAGAVISGGFNAYYTDKVCTAAYHLYRERFLARKYGPHLISDKVGALPEPAYEALLEGHEERNEDRRKESASIQPEEED